MKANLEFISGNEISLFFGQLYVVIGEGLEPKCVAIYIGHLIQS